MLDGESASRSDLGFQIFGHRDRQTGRDQFSFTGLDRNRLGYSGVQIVTACLRRTFPWQMNASFPSSFLMRTGYGKLIPPVRLYGAVRFSDSC